MDTSTTLVKDRRVYRQTVTLSNKPQKPESEKKPKEEKQKKPENTDDQSEFKNIYNTSKTKNLATLSFDVEFINAQPPSSDQKVNALQQQYQKS